ncbi:hypothetical protein M0R04_08205 [Candidatus Dojkabacteria bacterium]|jgi:hypothetical protein|nr:hypothetical protein [Candidatus Dojkabacteria bacterium]
MPEKIHCSLCGKTIRVKNFQDQMKKIRKHRKLHHLKEFKAGIKKGVAKRRVRK